MVIGIELGFVSTGGDLPPPKRLANHASTHGVFALMILIDDFN